MSDSVGRIGGNARPSQLSVSEQKLPIEGNKTLTQSPDTFLKLIGLEKGLIPPSVQSLAGMYPILNREARRRVFEKLCEQTFLNPEHPYYSIGAVHRERLQTYILDVLQDSHYLRSQASNLRA